MNQWYVKDLSQLTGVSVQTLHHYDRVGLLKPSVRLANGYRVYTEKDLLKLQQIIALKFFGFELAQISTLLKQQTAPLAHFTAQAQMLEQKANAMLDASHTLKCLIADANDNESFSWENIVKLIEVYQMTQELDHAWVKKIFTADELKEYAHFENEIRANATPERKAFLEADWDNIVAQVNIHLNDDPTSAIGIQIGERCIQWTMQLYGRKYAHLRNKIFDKGFCEGNGLDKVGLTPASVTWLEKALHAYWDQRICNILSQVGSASSETVRKLWLEVLEDMYGDDEESKLAVYEKALQNDKISSAAKQWLRNFL